MNEHEEKLIAAFIAPEKQARYRFLLNGGDQRRRNECLNRLNHCRDLDERFAHWLPRVGEAMAALDLVVFVPIGRPDRIAISDDDYPGLRRDVDRALRRMIVADAWGLGVDFIEVAGSERQRLRQVLRAIGAADGTNEGNR